MKLPVKMVLMKVLLVSMKILFTIYTISHFRRIQGKVNDSYQSLKKSNISFEETLWDTANKLRGSVESSEYKHVVQSLIFLKFIRDKFEDKRQALIDGGMGNFVEQVEFYMQDNVFYLPEEAR